MDNKNEYIICAANWYDDGKNYPHGPKNVKTGFIVCGRRHHNCISTFSRIVGFPYDEHGQYLSNKEMQGFLTSKDRWVTRLEAAEIAMHANQVDKENINWKLGLFSEDLY